MYCTIMIAYGIVGTVLFIIAFLLGRMTKKDILGNGVRLGIGNAFLLSVAWPITTATILIGWSYEIVKTWKKL